MFRCKLSKVPHWTEEGKKAFREVKSLFEKSRNSSHQTSGLKLVRLYEIEIENMKTDFEKISAKIGNVSANLWHGTKASNLLSILKSGLQIPKSSDSHCTGRMFGDGIYTSNQSTKALNYATNYWNGSGPNNQRTFMFLTEVALGKTNKPKNRHGSFPKPGTNSTWVEAGNCRVMNHECIVYETAQINLKYLCEFGAE
jgi:poly [ADP-ribose] polymerase 2/3/4